jgi:hypothetical protein
VALYDKRALKEGRRRRCLPYGKTYRQRRKFKKRRKTR